jgi:hypothetical protein
MSTDNINTLKKWRKVNQVTYGCYKYFLAMSVISLISSLVTTVLKILYLWDDPMQPPRGVKRSLFITRDEAVEHLKKCIKELNSKSKRKSSVSAFSVFQANPDSLIQNISGVILMFVWYNAFPIFFTAIFSWLVGSQKGLNEEIDAYIQRDLITTPEFEALEKKQCKISRHATNWAITLLIVWCLVLAIPVLSIVFGYYFERNEVSNFGFSASLDDLGGFEEIDLDPKSPWWRGFIFLLLASLTLLPCILLSVIIDKNKELKKMCE